MSVVTRRYDLEPLATAMGCTLAAACRRLGVSGSTMQEYRRDGVTEKVADRVAVKAGLHPYEVWPEMVDHAVESILKRCPECPTEFAPNRAWQTYCSTPCRRRARYRRQQATRRARDPQREAARKARWAEESRDYLRTYKRRWDAENREHRNAYARQRRLAIKNADDTGHGRGLVDTESPGVGPDGPQVDSPMMAGEEAA